MNIYTLTNRKVLSENWSMIVIVYKSVLPIV